MSANDLKAIKTALKAFTELHPTPRQSRAASAAATSDLENLFQRLDETLNNRLDSLMVKFQNSNAAFYNEYQRLAQLWIIQRRAKPRQQRKFWPHRC